ncbi:MAG: Tm-1-like ATP-binding domain-containing protein [Desulfitobacteriia bacterium]|jgi:uncharacterized protein (UPF0261 family)
MAPKSIALIVTVDTKEAEARFLNEFIENHGFKAPVLDVSTRNPHGYKAHYPREVVCKAGCVEFCDLKNLRRDNMMKTMGEGSAQILLDLYARGELAGVLAVGGNQGTAIASIAMRALPIGVPKLIVSTVASGYVRPYVEYKDIVMMFSVADILGGANTVSRTILTNAAGAVMGMSQYGQPLTRGAKPAIATTAFGNTDAAVNQARVILEKEGYEVIAFHASGASGSAMESLIEEGYIQGVLDMTTHELIGEVFGDDIYTPLRPRLEEAGKRGIPQVVVPGAIEYFCFGGPDTVPKKYLDRKTHYHNPYNTNIRATKEEVAKTAEVMAQKLNKSKGPVVVMLPLKGFSENGRLGGALYEPETDQVFINSLEKNLDPKVKVIKIDANINDQEFAERAAQEMNILMQIRR